MIEIRGEIEMTEEEKNQTLELALNGSDVALMLLRKRIEEEELTQKDTNLMLLATLEYTTTIEKKIQELETYVKEFAEHLGFE